MTHEDPDRIAAVQVDQVDQVRKLRRVVGSQAYLRRHRRGVKEHISGVNTRAAIAGSVAPRNRHHESRFGILVPPIRTLALKSGERLFEFSNLRKNIRVRMFLDREKT